MALVVLETICLLACGFYLYVLLHWVREGKAAHKSATITVRRWSRESVAARAVSFRRVAGWGMRPAQTGSSASCNECERMVRERIARATATGGRG